MGCPTGGAEAAASSQVPSKHLVIMDLHKAAEVYKLDFLHIDKPAAMLAAYKHVEGALSPEAAAKGLHEKLLRKLAANRSEWNDEDVQAMLKETMNTVATEQKATAGISGAVALILGSRLVVAVSHGAACAIGDSLPGDMKDIRIAASSESSAADVVTACITLEAQSASCVFLHTEAIDEPAARAAACHAERYHPRAAAVSLLQGCSGTAPTCRAAVCAHLGW